jgi:yecA family protein
MNQTPSQVPPFERFRQLLQAIELDVGASEIHGVITGLLCAGHADAHAAWFADLFANRSSEDLLVTEARQMLGQLYQATQEQLSDAGIAFSPYLPGDSLSLPERAECLTQWCQGFLYGLGLAEIDWQALAKDANEAILDITEFTKLDYENIMSDEASELAYVQLQEYLRVATLLIWEELSTIRNRANESK